MTFNELLKAIKKDNVSARKARNHVITNATKDLIVKLDELLKYGKVSEIEGMTALKKMRAEYKDTYDSFGNAPDSDIRTYTMDAALVAMEYFDTYLPKKIETARELEPFIASAAFNVSNDTSQLTMRDMGKIVNEVKALTNGAADGKLVATEVKAYIQAL